MHVKTYNMNTIKYVTLGCIHQGDPLASERSICVILICTLLQTKMDRVRHLSYCGDPGHTFPEVINIDQWLNVDQG